MPFKPKVIFLILVFAAVYTIHYWWQLGRPIDLVNAPVEKLNCVSYSPFHKPEQTPLDNQLTISKQQIEADLNQLSKQFACVRTYSVSQGLAEVPLIAKQLGMRVLLGIWIGRNPIDNEKELSIGSGLALQYPETVGALIIGNEVLMRREQTPTNMRNYLIEMKTRAPGIPVSYADSWDFWLRYQNELADVVSFATVHILPFWDNDTVAVSEAAEYVGSTYQRIKQAFNGKEILIGETGWPSYGRQRQDAESSQINQARFIREFSVVAKQQNIPYNIIEAFDQPWKRHSEGAVGGYWGIFSDDGSTKFALKGAVAEAPEWQGIAVITSLLILILLLINHRINPFTDFANAMLLGILSILGGGASVSYWRDMFMTNRTWLEWSYSTIYALSLIGVTLLSSHYFSAWFTRNQLPSSIRPANQWGDPNCQALKNADSWQGIFRFLFLLGATIVCILLVFDLRNRDYPLALFAVPALSFAVIAWIKGKNDAYLEEIVMALWIAIAGLWLPVIEHLIFEPDMSSHFSDGINPNVFYWTAICLTLSGSILVPAFLELRSRQRQKAKNKTQ
jgi:exo-beta-1,3-glucanase (GH17 family)